MRRISILIILLLAAPITAQAEETPSPFSNLFDRLENFRQSLANYWAAGSSARSGESPRARSEALGPWGDPVGQTGDDGADVGVEPPQTNFNGWIDPVEPEDDAGLGSSYMPLGPWADPVGQENENEAPFGNDNQAPLPDVHGWADPAG